MSSTVAAPALPPKPDGDLQPEWSPLLCFGFRVAFVFFTLDSLPRLIGALLGIDSTLAFDQWLMRWLVPWVGTHVLHLPRAITVLTGWDTAFGYLRELCRLALALATATVWTTMDTRRREYATLHHWLRVVLRYEVAWSVLTYGTAKVFQQQFPTPDLTTLVTPLGDLTPHTLLWNFMGFSRTYQVFTGWVECTGALLLFFRRTTTVGALIIVAAMANVAVMDYSYQTFVKMIAIHLMIGAAFLTIPDMPKLVKILLLRQPAPAAVTDFPRWHSTVWRRLSAVAKAIVIAQLLGLPSLHAWRRSEALTSAQAAPPLYGLYTVERFVSNGKDIPPEDPSRWRLIAIDGMANDYSGFSVRLTNESWEYHQTEYDSAHSIFTVIDGSHRSALNYSRTLDGVELHGALDGIPVEISLRRISEPPFPLRDPHAVRWVASW